MALNLKTELDLLVDALLTGHIPFAVCGGIAVTIHASPRFTRDIDLLVPPEAVDQAKQVARSRGFTLSAGPMVFGEGTVLRRTVHRVSKPDLNDLLTLDLIVAEGFLQPIWSGIVTVEWEGRVVPVVSRQGLITMKKAAGRPQDLVDVQNLGAGDEEA